MARVSISFRWSMLCTALVAWMLGFALGIHAEEASGPRIETDIVYRQVAGATLRLDVARPPDVEGLAPAIVCIHGGGWSRGDRRFMHPFVQYFAQHGYVTVAVSYRLSPQHRFPAHVEDVKAAVRFLRAHADEYGIDPQRIGALGFSAGGHLALMLAVTGPEDGLEGDGDHMDQSSDVQAAVNYFGSVDFRTWRVNEEAQRRIRNNFGGQGFEQVLAGIFGKYDPEAPIMRLASPVVYVDPQDPPMLSFHGTEDVSVPFSQALEFDRGVRAAGGRHRLVIMEDEGHGWTGDKLQQTLDMTRAFFDEHFKGHSSEDVPGTQGTDQK